MQRGLAGVPVEGAALHRGIEEGLVRVLPVEVDEARAPLGELSDRRQPAVDVRPAPAVARDDAGQHDLGTGFGVDEATFDACFAGAVTHE